MSAMESKFKVPSNSRNSRLSRFRNTRPYQALKRGSLSNMMRIGKRQMAQQQDYVQFPNEGQAPCESCNLGTLMRIGRR